MSDESRSCVDRRGRLGRWLGLGVAAGLLASAFPAVASASDYCVDDTVACGPKNVGTFEEALGKSAANDDADRIYLGPGIHTAPTANGFEYQNLNGTVEIIGSGRGGPSETVITGQSGATAQVLSLMGGPGTSISDVRLYLPANVASGLSGLRTNGTARRITVVEEQQQPNTRFGVTLYGGALEDSLVLLGPGTTAGVVLDVGGGTVRDSGASAYYGIIGYGGVVERTGVTAKGVGVLAYGSQTTITSSRVNIQGASGTGIGALVTAGFDTQVVADGVNVIGPDSPNAVAVRTSNSSAPDSSVSVTLGNSLLRRFGTTLEAQAGPGGSGSAHISASYSDYEPGKTFSSGTNVSIDETNISNVGDVGFKDASDGDYWLLPSSPLVDAGDPSTPQGLDAIGNPLVTDGNLDGTARRDIGAFELPGPLPSDQPAGASGGVGSAGSSDEGTPAADRLAPVLSRFSATTGRRTRLRYTLSESARVTITIQRALTGSRKGRYRTVGKLARNARQGAGSTVLPRRIGGHALHAGRYRAVARATDAAGNRSAARRARFRIAVR